ncbi:unnamed protein product, partial [Laminaria digitata]
KSLCVAKIFTKGRFALCVVCVTYSPETTSSGSSCVVCMTYSPKRRVVIVADSGFVQVSALRSIQTAGGKYMCSFECIFFLLRFSRGRVRVGSASCVGACVLRPTPSRFKPGTYDT